MAGYRVQVNVALSLKSQHRTGVAGFVEVRAWYLALLALLSPHRTLFPSQWSHGKKLVPAGRAAQRRDPEDPPENCCRAGHMLRRDALQFEVAANPAMGIEKRTKRHQAGVKPFRTGFAAPRQDARDTEEIVLHRPASRTTASRTVTNRAAYRAGADLFSPRKA